MRPRISAQSAARDERKANLLLASQLLRGQAALAVDDVGQRADSWVLRVVAWRNLLTHPAVVAAAGGSAAFFAAVGPQRRGRLWRGLRWAWLGWKLLQKRR
jgi:hypothetical protein